MSLLTVSRATIKKIGFHSDGFLIALLNSPVNECVMRTGKRFFQKPIFPHYGIRDLGMALALVNLVHFGWGKERRLELSSAESKGEDVLTPSIPLQIFIFLRFMLCIFKYYNKTVK